MWNPKSQALAVNANTVPIVEDLNPTSDKLLHTSKELLPTDALESLLWTHRAILCCLIGSCNFQGFPSSHRLPRRQLSKTYSLGICHFP